METILRMSAIDWMIFWFAIGSYTPLIIGVIKQKNDYSQTFPTWGLYFLLDFITMLSSNKINGSYVILLGFTVGSFVMATILFYQKRIRWTLLETIITILVIFCIVIWYTSGPYLATISGIMSEVFVGILLIIKTYRKPVVKYNLPGYIGFLIVSIIAIFATENWTLAQAGYPISETILSVIILIPLIKKWREESNFLI